jgi:NADH:ubiquinone reductase (non-electrogenic)
MIETMAGGDSAWEPPPFVAFADYLKESTQIPRESMTEPVRRICILGGGFGGLYTALRLNSLPWNASEPVEIVLMDQRDRFLFAPLLYELVTGELQTWEIAPPYGELLENTTVRFIQSAVSGVNWAIARCCCRIKSPSPTIASSSRLVAIPPWVACLGVADHAIPFRTVEDAQSPSGSSANWKLLTQKLFGWR